MILKLVPALCATLIVGLSHTSSAQVPVFRQDTTQIDLPPAFDAVLRAYEDGWRQRDADLLAGLFAEDGFVLRPGHPPVRGRKNIREAYRNSGGPLVLRAFAFGVDGTVGYIVGGFAREPSDPDIGKFVLGLRKDVTGRWLIAADIDNRNSR